ncbi:hypothetical protein ACUNKA_004540, partial [Enterobacter hormaechei]
MRDCSSCDENNCIMKTHKDIFNVDATQWNLKALFEHSYTLARVSMQGRPIKKSMDYIWGAIDVAPEITDRKALKKVEFQLSEICDS